MTFEFDPTDGDPFAFNSGAAGGRPSPGCGLVQIIGWSEYTGANGKAHELECEIIAWPNADDRGKTFTELIYHEDRSGKRWPQKRMACLAAVTGLLTPGMVAVAKSNGTTVSPDMAQLPGRIMFVELIEEPWQTDPNKTSLKIGGAGMAWYHVDDPRCIRWPKNDGVIAAKRSLIGHLHQDELVQPKAKPAQQPAAPPTVSGSEPDWSVF